MFDVDDSVGWWQANNAIKWKFEPQKLHCGLLIIKELTNTLMELKAVIIKFLSFIAH
jgi:hypothetical protein